MALPHAASGEVIDLMRADVPAPHTSVALAKTEQMELILLALEKGRAMPTHSVEGELSLQCLSGEIALDAHGRTLVLHPGQMLYLAGGEQHAVRANADSTALLTILLHRHRH